MGMAVLAIEVIRRRAFEVFRYPHQILALVVVASSMAHNITNILLLGFPILWYLIDFMIRVGMCCQPFVIVKAEALPRSVTKLTIQHASGRGFKHKPDSFVIWL